MSQAIGGDRDVSDLCHARFDGDDMGSGDVGIQQGRKKLSSRPPILEAGMLAADLHSIRAVHVMIGSASSTSGDYL